MKTKQVIETRIEELVDYHWLSFSRDDEDDIIFVENDETIQEAAKLWKMSPEAVKAMDDALSYLVETLIEELKKDLEDIWEKVE